MCIFCKIVSGEIASNKVLENDDFLAFHDISPKAPIHMLVIPKKHTPSFQEMDAKDMVGMANFIQDVTRKLGLDKNGYRLIVNNGEDGGQEVMHIHFHILGGAKLLWTKMTKNQSKKYI